MSRSLRLPWWGLMASKTVLSRLPIDYAFWKRFNLFVHGAMDDPDRAIGTVLRHARHGGLLPPAEAGAALAPMTSGWSLLELGPGDSLASAFIARALGASRSWLVDAGPYATFEPRPYAALAARLRALGLDAAETGNDVRGAFTAAGGNYLTDGVRSLATVPTGDVDFLFSNSVLEHVPLEEFDDCIRELARVMRPGAVAVHHVDLKDHLGGGLNNLRLRQGMWESGFMRRSGFYTNRLRRTAVLDAFANAGLLVERLNERRFDRLPLERRRMSAPWRDMDDAELMVSSVHFVARKPAGG